MLAHRLRPAAVTCSECGAAARDGDGWRAFVVGGYEGEDVEIVVFCPGCAEREVGSGQSRSTRSASGRATRRAYNQHPEAETRRVETALKGGVGRGGN